MTTDDTSRSPSLGGEQREGPTGREPGLSSEWAHFRYTRQVDMSKIMEKFYRIKRWGNCLSKPQNVEQLKDAFILDDICQYWKSD